jgi:hypothetical protein
MNEALGVSWAAGLGYQRDERGRVRVEAKGASRADRPSLISGKGHYLMWWSREWAGRMLLFPWRQSLPVNGTMSPYRFSSLLQLPLLSGPHNVGNALEGFFSAYNQRHQRVVA